MYGFDGWEGLVLGLVCGLRMLWRGRESFGYSIPHTQSQTWKRQCKDAFLEVELVAICTVVIAFACRLIGIIDPW
jgi:hypothetical protein